MTTNQRPEGDGSQHRSPGARQNLPLSPLRLRIKRATKRTNPNTGRQEDFYVVCFREFEHEETEYSQRDLLSEEAGAQALEEFLATQQNCSRREFRSPNRCSTSLLSGRSVIQNTPLRGVHRASEIRHQEYGASTPSQTSPGFHPGSSPAGRRLEDVQFPTPEKPPREDIQAALEWATHNLNRGVEVPAWQKILVDLTHSQTAHSDEVSLPQLEEQEVSGPCTIEESGVVEKVDLDRRRIQIYFHDGRRVWYPMAENASFKFTFNT